MINKDKLSLAAVARKAALPLAGAAVLLFVVIFVPVYVSSTRTHARHAAPPSPSRAAIKFGPLLTTQEECAGFMVPAKQQRPPLHPATARKPNFIYLLIDDMGYDDLSMHHPACTECMHNWVKTPNMNKLVRQSLEFTNFYTTPMCSTSRAELLTGRYYPRTGSMYINTGWDFMNVNETSMAEVFAAAGYKTSYFGKWHNGRTAGYMPSDVGFEDSYEPTPYVHYNNLMHINGKPVQTTGWMEDNLMGYAIDYLKQREADEKPFLIYYPFFSVHAGWMTQGVGPEYQRPAPPKYLDKFLALPLSRDTAHLYAMLEHIDDQIGRLLTWLDESGLADNTYVFLGGDNGPALFSNEQKPVPKEVRMPSGMRGSKHEVKEGGIRNFLAVRGPGIAQGGSNYQLAGLVDVLPTLVELAGIQQVVAHPPWDGISFANLLAGQPPTKEQEHRLYITMETQCIEDDFVPLMGPDRHTLKPQPLLSYLTGGVSGLGFKRCVGVRYQVAGKQYKWLADAHETQGRGTTFDVNGTAVRTGLYLFRNSSHVELACHEVSHSEQALAARLEAAAADWFDSMLASPHSFDRPTFFLGLGGKPSANIVTDATIERTPGRVQAVPMGMSGFKQPGDSSSYRIKVAVGGTYEVRLSYRANHKATFRVWVGPYATIKAGTAQHLDVTLPGDTAQRAQAPICSLRLPQTPAGTTWEVKLELLHNSQPGPALIAIDVIIFRLQGASGHIVEYEPDGQEGVRDWKVQHGYA